MTTPGAGDERPSLATYEAALDEVRNSALPGLGVFQVLHAADGLLAGYRACIAEWDNALAEGWAMATAALRDSDQIELWDSTARPWPQAAEYLDAVAEVCGAAPDSARIDRDIWRSRVEGWKERADRAEAERDAARKELTDQDEELGRVIDEVEDANVRLQAERDAMRPVVDKAVAYVARYGTFLRQILQEEPAAELSDPQRHHLVAAVDSYQATTTPEEGDGADQDMIAMQSWDAHERNSDD